MTLRPRDGGPVPAASFAMLRAHRELSVAMKMSLLVARYRSPLVAR